MQEQLILDAQQAWGQGIVKIGKVFLDKGDYRAAAESHINEFYNYQEGSVLFKPTLCSQKQFRLDFDGALSYSSEATATILKIMDSPSSLGPTLSGRVSELKSSAIWVSPWATISSRLPRVGMWSKWSTRSATR